MSVLDLMSIAVKEVRRVRRDESGIALMMTLSVFLLLYVVCAGVYSIGETVRQKIEIQNACDSAAYSAALVQADGLGRMAMVNRALSWTYIQLTNMQIDYITYRWLELVSKRFGEDSLMCQRENEAKFKDTTISLAFPVAKKCKESSAFSSKDDAGWFCGVAGKGSDCVRLNNQIVGMNGEDGTTPISAINDALGAKNIREIIQTYHILIPQFKELIRTLNDTQVLVSSQMDKSIAETISAVLFENLPRDEKTGEVDLNLAREFCYYRAAPTNEGMSPYDDQEDGDYYRMCFSPLYNTELDERIFLTMADGEVYDTLAEYFGPSGGEGYKHPHRFGGLDQWFVRSYANETFINKVAFPMTEKSLKDKGICRVYKNANRIEIGDTSRFEAYRGHHCGIGNGDDVMPSCINAHNNCPEQCLAVADSAGLCADYEWSSAKYDCHCYHIHEPIKCPPGFRCTHIHTYNNSFLKGCANHRCASCPGERASHARSQYNSCVAEKKDFPFIFKNFALGWPVENHCNNLGYPLSIVGYDIPTAEKDWKILEALGRYYNTVKPNGFSRIYGDDHELINKYGDYYVGEPAKPWILNETFYGTDGAIIVGLARKHRNPWQWLLNAVSDVVSSENAFEQGIYSAFNPVRNSCLVAFSAARAAHRLHPSIWGVARGAVERGEGEYETRYDVVCDDVTGYDPVLGGDGDGRFIISSDKWLKEFRVGCVCNNLVNAQRFARCWNLCETDWDATLLPLRFAQSSVMQGKEFFDSYRNDIGMMGNTFWANVGVDAGSDENGVLVWRNAFSEAYNGTWTSFSDVGDGESIDCSFLSATGPGVVLSTGRRDVSAPYGTVEVNGGAMIENSKSINGLLDLGNAIKCRVL